MTEHAGTLIQVERPTEEHQWELVQRLTNIYNMGKQAKGNMLNEWKRNFRLTMNRSSSALPAAAGIRANEVFPTIDSRIGWMTDQEISCSITPAADPFSAWFATQDILAEQLECVINSVYVTDQWYAEVVKMLWNSAMYGAGFLKVGWDHGLENGYGQAVIKSTSPWCLYIDPFCESLDDAEFIIEVHTMSEGQIERRFPTASLRKIRRALTSGDTSKEHVPPTQEQNVPRQGYLIPIDAGQGPTTWGPPGGAPQPYSEQPYRAVNVYECWIKENCMEWITPPDPAHAPYPVIVSEWRVIVHSGGEILLDEYAQNLYHTNRHPYVRYVDVETGELWGSALVRDIGPCQVAMNRLLALLQNNIEYTGNPIFVGVKHSGMDRSTFINRPGRIYDVDGGPSAQNAKPQWLNPPTMPSVIIQFLEWWREEIERLAGMQGGQRGEIPSGRATDKQVSATQEAGFIRIRSAQRNLELCLRKAFELVANIIIINYDVPRTAAIVGPEGEMNAVRLAANHFYCPGPDGPAPLRFAMLVNAGSSKPTSRAARISEAVQLLQLKVVDRQYVAQAFRVSHWQAVLKRVQEQEQQEAILQAIAGGGPGGGQPKGPGTGHAHGPKAMAA
jgi:hypothetical protein